MPVFPLRPGTKVPATEHGFQDASTDADQIRQWWKRWPRANIGMPTGARSGLVVIDEDPRHGGNAAALGLPGTTLTAHTAGGGRHFYYLHPGDGVKIPIDHKGTLGAGIDMQGDDAYVVLAPSVVNGRAYEWDTAAADDIADLPARLLLPLLLSKTTPATTPEPSATPATYTPRPSGDAAAHWLGKAMERTGAGVGDATGYWLALQLLTDPDVSDNEAFDAGMRYAAAATINPAHPFTERDVRRWFKSAEQSDIVRRGEPARGRAPVPIFTATSRAAQDGHPPQSNLISGMEQHDGCAACAEKDKLIADLRAEIVYLRGRLQWDNEVLDRTDLKHTEAVGIANLPRKLGAESFMRRVDGDGWVQVDTTEYARECHMSPGTASNVLELAEKMDLIEREKRPTLIREERQDDGTVVPVYEDRFWMRLGHKIDAPHAWQRPEDMPLKPRGGARPGAGRKSPACPKCHSADTILTERKVVEVHCRTCKEVTQVDSYDVRILADSRDEETEQAPETEEDTPSSNLTTPDAGSLWSSSLTSAPTSPAEDTPVSSLIPPCDDPEAHRGAGLHHTDPVTGEPWCSAWECLQHGQAVAS